MPPDQRTNYHCEREATGPVDRKQLIDHINKIALETPDQPESVPFVAGVVRGKKVNNERIIVICFPCSLNRQVVIPKSSQREVRGMWVEFSVA